MPCLRVWMNPTEKTHFLRSTLRFFFGRYSEVCHYVPILMAIFFYFQEMATNYGIARQKIPFFLCFKPSQPSGVRGFLRPETMESRLFQTEDAIIFPCVFVVFATIIRGFLGKQHDATSTKNDSTTPSESSPRGSYQCGNTFEIGSMQRILVHSDAGM